MRFHLCGRPALSLVPLTYWDIVLGRGLREGEGRHLLGLVLVTRHASVSCKRKEKGSERDKYGGRGLFGSAQYPEGISMQSEKKTDGRKGPAKKGAFSWEPVKVIIHKETKIAARVSRLPIKPRPKYSYELGCVDEEDNFKRFLQPVVEIKDGKVEVIAISPDAVQWAMEEAEIYIVEEMQKRESEIQLQAKTREPKKKQEGTARRPST
jgi:hypothetical protein